MEQCRNRTYTHQQDSSTSNKIIQIAILQKKKEKKIHQTKPKYLRCALSLHLLFDIQHKSINGLALKIATFPKRLTNLRNLQKVLTSFNCTRETKTKSPSTQLKRGVS